jgi:hypothetical protein
MKKSIALLQAGFESSSGLTPEFAQFFRTFKSEFTKELQTIGATDIVFSRGHFYVSGFFTVSGQAYYFSISDVRGSDYRMPQLMYRTAKHYKDFTGGANRWVDIAPLMADKMCWYFKIID